jgi:mRNA interferase MazF
MAKFIKGSVVVVPFPFSDLSQAKKRPALVITDLNNNDLILCQITSQQIYDDYSIALNDKDFSKGSLKKESNIRPNRVFTADKNIILYEVGQVNEKKINQVIEKIIEIVKS